MDIPTNICEVGVLATLSAHLHFDWPWAGGPQLPVAGRGEGARARSPGRTGQCPPHGRCTFIWVDKMSRHWELRFLNNRERKELSRRILFWKLRIFCGRIRASVHASTPPSESLPRSADSWSQTGQWAYALRVQHQRPGQGWGAGGENGAPDKLYRKKARLAQIRVQLLCLPAVSMWMYFKF